MFYPGFHIRGVSKNQGVEAMDFCKFEFVGTDFNGGYTVCHTDELVQTVSVSVSPCDEDYVDGCLQCTSFLDSAWNIISLFSFFICCPSIYLKNREKKLTSATINPDYKRL